MPDFIDNYIDQNEKVTTFLDQIGRDFESADNNFELFKAFLIDTKYNTALGVDFANFIQLLDNEKNIKDFKLGDIRRLFNSLMKTQEFNIDTYLEAGHFEWAFMDNKEKAIEIIKKGIDKALEKTEELKRLLNKIGNKK